MAMNVMLQSPGFIGWKNKELLYLGCNENFSTILQLKDPEQIVGLSDRDLIDYNEQAFIFHYENDMRALSGETVECLHVSTAPYDLMVFNMIKKPLMDAKKRVVGVIFHCSPLNKAQIRSVMSADVAKTSDFGADNYSINEYKLSKRERECLSYLLRGKTVREISMILGLSKRTVETYVENVKHKFRCHTRTELLVEAIKKGYMEGVANE